jgi:hypothetical protein
MNVKFLAQVKETMACRWQGQQSLDEALATQPRRHIQPYYEWKVIGSTYKVMQACEILRWEALLFAILTSSIMAIVKNFLLNWNIIATKKNIIFVVNIWYITFQESERRERKKEVIKSSILGFTLHCWWTLGNKSHN